MADLRTAPEVTPEEMVGSMVLAIAAAEEGTGLMRTTLDSMKTYFGIGEDPGTEEPEPTAVRRPIAFFFTAAPAAGETLVLYSAAEALTLPAALAGSVGKCQTPPAADLVLSVRNNGQKVGTITIAASGAVSFAAGSAVAIAVGDQLSVTAPAQAAAAVANASFTLLATVA